jgi:outer membrane lipoprotein SlyB
VNNEKKIFQSLINNGFIGSAMGYILTGKEKATALGTLAGTVILSALKANENAQKTNMPLVVEEDNVLYEVNAKGEKRFIKNILKPTIIIPNKFKLS